MAAPVEARSRMRTRSGGPAIVESENVDHGLKRCRVGKRAAMEGVAKAGPGGVPKKRPALADVTNRRLTRGEAALEETKDQLAQRWDSLSQRARAPAGDARENDTAFDETARKPLQDQVGAVPGEPATISTFPGSENRRSTRGSTAAAVAALEESTKNRLVLTSGGPSKGTGQHVRPSEVAGECLGWTSTHYKDIDAEYTDPQMCATYVNDIYKYLRESEFKRRPSTKYMEAVQTDINANMRGILVDWLVEVAEEYKLVPDTLYLTVNFIDRLLTENQIMRSKLQLVGVASMLIASKYEEIYAPQVDEFCYITDNTYGRDEVLEMERCVLKALRFELTTPTTKSFLRRFVRAAQAPPADQLKLEFLSNYLAELTLLDYDLLRFLPSKAASGAVFMAKYTLDPTTNPWSRTLQHYTGYKPSELRECVEAIHRLQLNTKGCTLPAVREKYRQHKFKCVGVLPPPATLPDHLFEDTPESVT